MRGPARRYGGLAGRSNGKTGVDEVVGTSQNVRPSRQRRTPKPARKKSQQGVDGNENYPIMCGSLGRFGGDGKEVKRDEALRPIPTIFDSVRR